MGVKRVCYVCNATIPIGPKETLDPYISYLR